MESRVSDTNIDEIMLNRCVFARNERIWQKKASLYPAKRGYCYSFYVSGFLLFFLFLNLCPYPQVSQHYFFNIFLKHSVLDTNIKTHTHTQNNFYFIL